ncbi:TonB-linked SusC/RagA family outer membrane protein [Pedobacter sp. CAN_A7]|uniref:SusC/RagA family TonB-linked outer membrane protein n=1 Tax=Pedobacter sp. CAN_A7 TaxID=2787722 RepID=UPI0018CACCAD
MKPLHNLKKLKWLCNKSLATALVCASVFSGSPTFAALDPVVKTINLADITITGRVLDEQKKPIPGVNVSIAGTTLGTVTDGNGNYKLNVPDAYAGRNITFSYTGYVKQEVSIAGKTEISISLVPDNQNLSEVVVVGYGTQARVSLTGAVNEISAKNIENKPVLNTLQALQGEAPNLIIQQSQLNPGSNVSINIRGVGTLGNNDPLVVIDGIIGGNINTLNPNDIASVSVLKDAGSAAIYGSRAANGVLLVTTKSGKLNQKPTLTYNGSFGLQDPNVLVQKVGAWDNASYKNESLVNSGLPAVYTPEQIQELKNQGNGTWDVNHLLKNAPQQAHNVSISGGGETNSYYLSAGYQDQKSNLIGNGGSGPDFGYTKYNLRLNQTSQIGVLRVNMILNYTKTRNKTNTVGDNNIFADANRVPLNYSWQDAEGNYLTNPVASQYNEYGVLEKGGANQSDNDEIFGNLNGQVNITKDLKLTGIFGGTIANNGNFFRRTKVNFLPSGVYGDDLTVFDNNAKSLLMNTQLLLEYNKTVNDHTFKVLFGASNENFSSRGFQLQKTLTDPYLGTSTTGTLIDAINSYNSIANDQWSLNSLFSRINYSYKGRYLFEATVRDDMSSRFAKGNRASFFPSVNLGWLLTEESFMESINAISNLKLRASYGILGNQNVGAYQYQTTYFNYPIAYGFNNQSVGGAGFNLGNSELTWEKAATLNLGIDAAFFDNKLALSFDYFNKVTSDILQPRYDVPRLFGAGLPDYNVAKVRNKGWEATATYNLRTGEAAHSFSVNVADSKNKLLTLTGGTTQQIINQDVFQLIRRVGEPITQYFGYETNGYFQNDADVASYPKPAGADVGPGDLKFKDLNSDGIIDDKDKTVLGNPFPRYTFGFTYRVNYKNFDFQVFLQGVGKRDAFLRGELVEPFHYNYGATLYDHMTDYWSPENPDARYPRLAAVGSASNTNNWRSGSDIYKYNAAYIRLKNINIGYTLPKSFSKKAGMERLRVSLIGQNLLTLTKLKFIDPETTEFGNNVSVASGSNNARSYPLPVFYGAGIDITF